MRGPEHRVSLLVGDGFQSSRIPNPNSGDSFDAITSNKFIPALPRIESLRLIKIVGAFQRAEVHF